MPTKKTSLSEIKEIVILDIEGLDAVGIAKQLTEDAFAKLYETKVITDPKMLRQLTALNKKRNAQYMRKQIINDLKASQGDFTPHQITNIKNAFVTVDRIRRIMKSEVYIEYKDEFQKQHLQLIAKQEAKRYVEKKE